MPLVRAHGIPTRDGVVFTMSNTAQYVYCVVTREALVSQFGGSGTEIFNQHRAAIERAASDKFDRGELEPDEVVVVEQTDFNRPNE